MAGPITKFEIQITNLGACQDQGMLRINAVDDEIEESPYVSGIGTSQTMVWHLVYTLCEVCMRCLHDLKAQSEFPEG